MARLPEITSKADLPADKRHIFDAIGESRGTVGFPFSLLLNSPEVAGRIAHLGTYLRFESTLPPIDREIAILIAARESDCEFEWAFHSRLALQTGVAQETIDVIAQRGDLDQLTETEAQLLAYGRELLRNHRVTNDTFEAARAKFGNQGVTELTAILGYYSMLACALNAFEAEAPLGRPRLP
ncbi:MAG: carboxymuconolactone decarboxylase family protein [Dehalococcoidia bacterium]|nr:carboxymuconolactone decarboxylase family protein [Dehalococcoidia bacterium]